MEGPSKELFRNAILVGLSFLSVPTLDTPEAALGRAGESGHLSHTIRLMAVPLADKGSKGIRGNYQAGSLFPRFNGPSHCNCTCWYQTAPSHPKARSWAGVWVSEGKYWLLAHLPTCCLETLGVLSGLR